MTIISENLLPSFANPYRYKTYTVSIIQEFTQSDQVFLFGLRYVPDKLLLNPDGLAGYLEQFNVRSSNKTEILANEILENIMNQIIPKWIEVNLKHEENKYGQKMLITIEDRQPGWENDPLLGRLPAIFS